MVARCRWKGKPATRPLNTLVRPLSRDVMFSFVSSSYQLGRTIAAVPAQQPVEHVKNALQNITREQTRSRRSRVLNEQVLNTPSTPLQFPPGIIMLHSTFNHDNELCIFYFLGGC